MSARHPVGELIYASYVHNRAMMQPEAIARCLALDAETAAEFEERYKAVFLMRGDQQVDTETSCSTCLGSGLTFISINAYGDRVREVCKCPAGDAERGEIERAEQRLRRDEALQDLRSGQ